MTVSGFVSPIYEAGAHVSFKIGGTAATVTPGDPVEVAAGDNLVIRAASDSRKVIGVAVQGGVTGDFIQVVTRGPIFLGKAKGAITRGDQLMAGTDALGTISTLAFDVTAVVNQTTVNAAIAQALGAIGVALESIADTLSGRWMLI